MQNNIKKEQRWWGERTGHKNNSQNMGYWFSEICRAILNRVVNPLIGICYYLSRNLRAKQLWERMEKSWGNPRKHTNVPQCCEEAEKKPLPCIGQPLATSGRGRGWGGGMTFYLSCPNLMSICSPLSLMAYVTFFDSVFGDFVVDDAMSSDIKG